MIKIAVMTETNDVWLLDAWVKTFKLLSNEGFSIVGIIETPSRLSQHTGLSVPLWYVYTFGLHDFIKLSLFSINRLIRRWLSPHGSDSSLKKIAENQRIKYIKCKTPNDKKIVDWIHHYDIDIVACTTSFIINKKTLQAPRLGFVNKHAALLPSNKGLFPYFWAHSNSQPQGISYHLMVEEIDKGPLLHQVVYPKSKDSGSMVNFYRHVFYFFPEHMFVAIKACVSQRFISPLTKVKSNYFGLPSRKDVIEFRRKGGKIITWIDIYNDIFDKR